MVLVDRGGRGRRGELRQAQALEEAAARVHVGSLSVERVRPIYPVHVFVPWVISI
jgi:hypothetical protein